MKPRYKDSDFKTYFAWEYYQTLKESIDYDLMEEFADATAKASYSDLIRELNEKVTEDMTELPPDIQGLDLGDGRVMTRDEITSLMFSRAHKYTADACFTFERVFRENKTAESILEICQGTRKSMHQPQFGAFLRLYPTEATFIRTELQHPNITQHPELYNWVMNNLTENLMLPLVPLDPRYGSKIGDPIGIQQGPRIPHLEFEELSSVFSFWAGRDIAFAEYLPKPTKQKMLPEKADVPHPFEDKETQAIILRSPLISKNFH